MCMHLLLAQKHYQANFILGLQDVVEIMKESLFDKLVDENGHVDVGRSGGMSQQKEGKRFLSVLQRKANAEEKSLFSIAVSANPIAFNLLLGLDEMQKQQFYDLIFHILLSCRSSIALQMKFAFKCLMWIHSLTN